MESLPVNDGVEYRAVAGWPGYAVGDDGSVWSCRTTQGTLGGTWRKRGGAIGAHGYEVFCLYGSGKKLMVRVHRMVYEAFNGPLSSDAVACHDDGDKRNNRLSNLRGDTQHENIKDKRRHGTQTDCELHHRAKLTNKQATEILDRHSRGERQVDLAAEFQVTRYAIWRLVHRKNWLNLVST